MYAITNGIIYTGLQVLHDHSVIIDGDKIVSVVPMGNIPEHMEQHHVNGAIISPGFIDIQLNGCGGVQFNEHLDNLSIETINTMHHTNVMSGCTNFLPTLITSTDDFMRKAIDVMREYKKKYSNQAIGLHLEGPYLNPLKKGIHNESLIRKPTDEMINFLAENRDVISIITLAPEQVDERHIKQLTDAGILVSIGHSNATYTEAFAGFNAGIRLGTHLYNAMSTTLGREPSVVGAIYDANEVYCGIICDGLHVDWANVRNSHRIKGDKLILVTDASLATGTDLKQFEFGGKIITHRDGKFFGSDGTLAGSALTMIQAIKNCVQYANIPLAEALRMATLYPANALGITTKFGTITSGKVANLAVFDSEFKIKKTVVNGIIQPIT